MKKNHLSTIDFNNLSYSNIYDHLVSATRDNDLDTVKKIITSTDIKKHDHFFLFDNGPLTVASCYGHLSILEFLIKSVEADFKLISQHLLVSAGISKQKHIVKYLLSSSDLKPNPDIHFDNDELFRKCSKDLDMIQYLIFDLNIEKTERIEMYLDYLVLNPPNNAKEIIKLFETRELAESLKNEMTPNNESSTNKKLKL